MLSKTKCVFGTEIFYALCIAYGLLLSGKSQELHHALFEMGKTSKCRMGRGLYGSAGMGCSLVRLLDAQRKPH
jgi:hypothetical protein